MCITSFINGVTQSMEEVLPVLRLDLEKAK
jgi:hypothetical protein